MKTFTRTAPSAWASYLINGDDSGLTDGDRHAVTRFEEQYGAPVDCADAGFLWVHDASHLMPLGADCQRYTFFEK